MLIQKELEARLISELQSALAASQLDVSCRVTGSWQPVATGLVRWVEDDTDVPAIVSVALGTPGRSTFSDPRNDISGKIALFLRHEKDPTGGLLVTIASVIQQTIDDWQKEACRGPFTRFDLSSFSVNDLTVSQGSSPSFNGDKVAVEWPITLYGSFITQNQGGQ